jgi:Tuberculosis necrotizing toxin
VGPDWGARLKLGKTLAVFATAAMALTFASAAPAASAHAGTPAAGQSGAAEQSAAAGGRTPPDQCSADYFDGDPRLGPARLPVAGLVGRELAGYRRTGGMPVQRFLATYWNPAANSGQGGWIYPPDDGYVVRKGGQPVKFQLRLRPGRDIDRYGSPYGTFLSPEGVRYSRRSIPPQNLDGTPPAACDYHEYRVVKSFRVDAGPVASWFGQPGHGLQYQLDLTLVPGAPATLNVLWLIVNGYLQPLT